MANVDRQPKPTEPIIRNESHRLWNAISKVLLYGGVGVAIIPFFLGAGPAGVLPGAGMAIVGHEMKREVDQKAANIVLFASKAK